MSRLAGRVCLVTGSTGLAASAAERPIRVMILILTTTYGESVISTPKLGCSASSGPIQKGTTYIVRPFIDPVNFGSRMAFISRGAIQLFVGPASPLESEQI